MSLKRQLFFASLIAISPISCAHLSNSGRATEPRTWPSHYRESIRAGPAGLSIFDPVLEGVLGRKPPIPVSAVRLTNGIELSERCGKTWGGCFDRAKGQLLISSRVSDRDSVVQETLNPDGVMGLPGVEDAVHYVHEQSYHSFRGSSPLGPLSAMRAELATIVFAMRFIESQSANMGTPMLHGILDHIEHSLNMLDGRRFEFDSFERLHQVMEMHGEHQSGLLLFGYLIRHFNYDAEKLYTFAKAASPDEARALATSMLGEDPIANLGEFVKACKRKHPYRYRCEARQRSEISFACSAREPPESEVRSDPKRFVIENIGQDYFFDRHDAFAIRDTYEGREVERILALVRQEPELLEQYSMAGPWELRRVPDKNHGDIAYGRNPHLFVVVRYDGFSGSFHYCKWSTSCKKRPAHISVYMRQRDGRMLDVFAEISGNRAGVVEFKPNLPTDIPDEMRHGLKIWRGFATNDKGKESLNVKLRNTADAGYQARVRKVLERLVTLVGSSR
jgi:hypothetical protein